MDAQIPDGFKIETIDYDPNNTLTGVHGQMVGRLILYVQTESPEGNKWLTGDPSIDPPKKKSLKSRVWKWLYRKG